MPLKKPNSEDVIKINSEITQIVNQRFLITTTAITVFGVMIAWMFPKSAPNPGDSVGSGTFLLSGLLLVVLFMLYLSSHFLKRTLRFFTTYLIVTDSSNWEVAWRSFREKGHFAYTKDQTVLFLILNLIASAFPFIFAAVSSLKIKPVWAAIGCIFIWAITTIFMCLMGFVRCF